MSDCFLNTRINYLFLQGSVSAAASPKVPINPASQVSLNASAKALNMSPADYQKQMESYLKMYNMEGPKGIAQLQALQKTDTANALLYQQMISLLSSKNNKVGICFCCSTVEFTNIFIP